MNLRTIEASLELVADFCVDNLLFFQLVFVFTSIVTLVSIHEWKKRQQEKIKETGKKSVSIVTAHPDDEAMFFLPTVLNLRPLYHLHVLCLSNGGAYNQGETREREFKESMESLGLKGELVEDSELPDSMSVVWNEKVIAKHVKKHLETHGIEALVSFDEYGVSGHTNHIQISKALRLIGADCPEVKVFELESRGIIRKYLGMFDIFLTYSGDFTYLNFNLFETWRAMKTYRSQFVWYRKLFVLFSSYGYVNVLNEVPVKEKQE